MTDNSAHHRTYLQHPNLGRVYDYILGGSLNTPADRSCADDFATACPRMITVVRNQRVFLTRAVEYMIDEGVRQFVDLGSGLPTAGPVHTIAHNRSTNVSTVYVDNDQETVAQARIVLAKNSNSTVLRGDLTDPESVLRDIDEKNTLDHQKATGILLVGTLDLVTRLVRPAKLLAAYRTAFPAGLYVAVTMLVVGRNPDDRTELGEAAAVLRRIGSNLVARPASTVRRWFANLYATGNPVEVGFVAHPLGDLSLAHGIVRYASDQVAGL